MATTSGSAAGSAADQGQQRRWRDAGGDGLAASLKRTLDKPLTSYHLVLGVSGLLMTLGLLMVLSASSVSSLREYDSSYAIFMRQAMWVVIGVPLAYLTSRLPRGLIRGLSWPALIISVLLIAATYIPHVGVTIHGNRNWISFGGPFQIQPSELGKLALVLWLADVYARKGRLLGQWRHLLVPMVPACLVVVGLVIGQGDLGTALVLFAIVLGMLWVVGAPTRLFMGTFLVVAVAAFALVSTERERVERLTGFLDPMADYGGAVGRPATASSRWPQAGSGAAASVPATRSGAGCPRLTPTTSSPSSARSSGLFGTVVVLGLFATLAYAGVRIAARTKDPFVRYASAGIVVWLLSQALINIGMVLGLLPVIGIPLPLISYGGSALLPTLVALGLLMSFARTEPGAKAALRARKRRTGRTAARPRPQRETVSSRT